MPFLPPPSQGLEIGNSEVYTYPHLAKDLQNKFLNNMSHMQNQTRAKLTAWLPE